MTRPPVTSEWNRPRYVSTAQLQNFDWSDNIQDVDWNNIFIVAQSWSWDLIPIINSPWS